MLNPLFSLAIYLSPYSNRSFAPFAPLREILFFYFGSVKKNVEPFPGWDSTQIVPP